MRPNTPISTILMVSEMTASYNLLLPAMLVCITGIVYADDLRGVAEERHVLDLLIAADVKSLIRTVTPDATLLSVVNLMAASGRRELVVVEKHHSYHVVGTNSDADIIATYNKQFRVERASVPEAAESD